MRGMTHVELAGTLTQDAELSYTPGGLAILLLNLAGSDRIHTPDGEKLLAWYHRAKLFGSYAETIADDCTAGTPLYLLGRLEHREWTNQNGDKRNSVDLIGNIVKTLAAPPDERLQRDNKQQARLLDATNRALIMGNLTREAELRYTSNGYAFANLSVAVNEKRKDKEDRVGFFQATAWRDLAERVGGTPKGAPVVVGGRLVVDKWTDRNNNTRYTTKIDAHTIELVQRPNQPADPGTRATTTPPAGSGNPNLDIDDEFPPEEDLPF